MPSIQPSPVNGFNPVSPSLTSEVHEVTTQVKSLEIPKEENQGFFSGLANLFGSGVSGALKKKREQVCHLEGKLEDLEKQLRSLETRDRSNESAEIRMLRDQNIIATKELVLEVELALTKAIREEYALRYKPSDPEYKTMDASLKRLEGRIKDESQAVLKEESRFWGLAKLWTRVQNSRYAEEAEQDISLVDQMGGIGPAGREIKTPESVRMARDAIMEELQLKDIDRLSDGLDAKGKLERKRDKITEEIKMLKSTIAHHGRVDHMGYSLTPRELIDARMRLMDEEITLQETDIQLKEIELNAASSYLNDLARLMEPDEMIMDEVKAGIRDAQDPDVLEAKERLSNDQRKKEQLERQVDRLPVEIDRMYRDARKLKARRDAQLDVNQLLNNESSIDAFIGSTLDRGIEVLSRMRGAIAGTREDLGYHWENSEWGELLASENAGVMKNFRDAVGTLKKGTRDLKARREVLTERKEEIQTRLKENQWATLEDGEAVKAEWKEQVAKLDQALQETKAAENDMRIAMRAAFLQKLVDSINDRQVKRRTSQQQLDEANIDIENLQVSAERQQEKVDNLFGVDKEAAVKELLNIQENLAKQEAKAQQLTEEIQTIEHEVRQLNAGYQLQREKYMKLRPSQRGLMEHMKNMAKQLLPLGFGSNRYKPIKEFDLDKQFAMFGYTISDGLKQFGEVRGDNMVGALSNEVSDFLKFMDDYPGIGLPMVSDIALTLSFLQDKGPLDHLLVGLRARGYTEAMLGQLGRELEMPPRLTEENYAQAAKWKAMADIARYGPMAGNAPRVVQSAFEGYGRGGWLGAVLGGAGQAAFGAAQAEVTRNVINSMDPASVRLSIAALSFIRGDEPKKVLEEQRNLALMSAVGEAQRAIRKPRTVFRGLQRAVSNQWRAFKRAGLGEKAARFAVQVGIPAVGVGGAAALVGLAIAGPIGWVAALGLAVASLAVAFTMTAVATTAMRRIEPFRSTMDEAKAAYAREQTLTNTRINELKTQRDAYVDQLQEKAILLPPRTPAAIAPASVQSWRDQEHSRIQEIQSEQLQALNSAMEQRSENGPLQVREIRDLFIEHADANVLRERIKTAVTDELAGLDIDSRDIEEIISETTYNMQQELVREWLKPNLDPAFQMDFVNMVMQYESPEQWEEAQAQQRQQVAADTELLNNNLKRELRNALPADLHPQVDGMANKLQSELGYRQSPAYAGA